MRSLKPFTLLACACAAGVSFIASAVQDAPTTGVARLKVEAAALQSLGKTDVSREFLDAVANLPSIQPRELHRDKATGQWLSSAEVAALPEEKRDQVQTRTADESVYYNTKYGSPLAYARPLEILGQNDLKSLTGKRILDIGYGTIGHLRMMASCGGHAIGLDVDPFLTALYSDPSDQGIVQGRPGVEGSVKLVNGRFSEEKVNAVVGNGFDLIFSKNTLKRGYIHPPPEENVDKRMLVDLGLNDKEFVQTLFDLLKPGGAALIYNLSPKPAGPGEKYIPWADGRCPFDRELLEQTGFKVVQYDANDDAAARAMAHALGWDQGEHPMNLETDLFAHYTLLMKPAK